MAEEAKKNSKQDKVYTYLAALVVCGLLIWLGSGLFKGNKAEDTENSKDTSSEVAKTTIEGTNLTKSGLEYACQDAKYGVANGYDVVAISGYDFQTYDTGSYDENGNLILQAMWNGKRNSDKQVVKYWCYASGADDDNIVVHYISVGNDSGRKDIWKTQKDLNAHRYNQSGEPEYPDLH